VGTGKNLKALGFEPHFGLGKFRKTVMYHKKKLKRGPFRADVIVSAFENATDGLPIWDFSITSKLPPHRNGEKRARELVHMSYMGYHQVKIHSDIGTAHDRQIARKTVQSVGWQTTG
jgi:hypothetical protein